MAAKIYIISDNPHNLHSLYQTLTQDGYEVFTGSDTKYIRDALEKTLPDLMILDVERQHSQINMMCQDIRAVGACSSTPLLVIALRANAQQIAGMLDSGADDVLRKPYVVRELQARLRVLLRWRKQGEPITQQVRLFLDPTEQIVQVNHRRVRLTPVEFQLLRFLCQNQSKYYTALDLLQILWSYPPKAGDTALVRNHIRNLRCKLEPDPGHPNVLVSQYGRGYTVRAIVQQS